MSTILFFIYFIHVYVIGVCVIMFKVFTPDYIQTNEAPSIQHKYHQDFGMGFFFKYLTIHHYIDYLLNNTSTLFVF